MQQMEASRNALDAYFKSVAFQQQFGAHALSYDQAERSRVLRESLQPPP